MRKWSSPRRKIIIIIGVLISLWLINRIFFGISFDFFAKQRLDAAKAAWENQHIRDYRMIIEVRGGFILPTQYEVTIRDNQVIDAGQRLAISLVNPDYVPSSEQFSPVPVENASQYTMDNLFSSANSKVANDAFVHINNACNRYVVDFDPRMSFVNLYANKCDGSLLGCQMRECESTYRVIELEPLSAENN
ncbi:MAG: DUF6174 domain-containing protein [Chloroflexota bacterium]